MNLVESLKWMDELCKKLHENHPRLSYCKYCGIEVDHDFVYINLLDKYDEMDWIGFPLELIDEELSWKKNLEKINDYLN